MLGRVHLGCFGAFRGFWFAVTIAPGSVPRTGVVTATSARDSMLRTGEHAASSTPDSVLRWEESVVTTAIESVHRSVDDAMMRLVSVYVSGKM